jgi:hypothetical protein
MYVRYVLRNSILGRKFLKKVETLFPPQKENKIWRYLPYVSEGVRGRTHQYASINQLYVEKSIMHICYPRAHIYYVLLSEEKETWIFRLGTLST